MTTLAMLSQNTCPCIFILNNCVSSCWILIKLSMIIFPLEDKTLVTCSFSLILSEILVFLALEASGQERQWSLSSRILKRAYNISKNNIHALFRLLFCRISNNTSSITFLKNIPKYLAFSLLQVINELLKNKCEILYENKL
jgi:hypothetical protein